MSKIDDLISYRRGSLVVTAFLRFDIYAGQTSSFWQCLCERCGRVVELPRVRITNAKKSHGCCDICHRGGCLVCGNPVIGGKTIRHLCSDECKAQWTSKRKREGILEKKKIDPNYYANRYAEMKNRHLSDHVANDSYKASQRKASLKYYYSTRRYKMK